MEIYKVGAESFDNQSYIVLEYVLCVFFYFFYAPLETYCISLFSTAALHKPEPSSLLTAAAAPTTPTMSYLASVIASFAHIATSDMRIVCSSVGGDPLWCLKV